MANRILSVREIIALAQKEGAKVQTTIKRSAEDDSALTIPGVPLAAGVTASDLAQTYGISAIKDGSGGETVKISAKKIAPGSAAGRLAALFMGAAATNEERDSLLSEAMKQQRKEEKQEEKSAFDELRERILAFLAADMKAAERKRGIAEYVKVVSKATEESAITEEQSEALKSMLAL